MNIEQLTGRYLRLQQELELAYRRTPWQAAHIDRLASDLAATERELGRLRPGSAADALRFLPAQEPLAQPAA